MEMVGWVLFIMLIMVKWVNGSEPLVPCYFIFGDSLLDSGNNNNLKTEARVNYPPYGIDFPGGVPTGRFCNGKTSADFLAEFMGFDHPIPPFATANGSIIVQGVNYASGSAGILNQTGKHLGENVDFHQQIENHRKTIEKMFHYLKMDKYKVTEQINHRKTLEKRFHNLNVDKYKVTEQINKCLYAVGMGNNDYLNNYFLPDHYNTSQQFSFEQFADHLIQQYSQHIQSLYQIGARKIYMIGVGNIGCVPFALQTNLEAANGSGCVQKMNDAVTIFNDKLGVLIHDLNTTLEHAKFVYVNSTSLASEDPTIAGFTNFIEGCCKTRKDGQCKEDEQVCSNRQQFSFWDSFHPTEASNRLSAAVIFNNSSPFITSPYDIHTLATLH